MRITQTFYDNLATQYDKLFLDWQATTQEQAIILDRLFQNNGFDKSARILDCACGIINAESRYFVKRKCFLIL